jgi:hypothetical protein
MWIDADNMWEPIIPEKLKRSAFQTAIAIGYAENECVETSFPANNPIAGAPEIVVSNPLTPFIDRFLLDEDFEAILRQLHSAEVAIGVCFGFAVISSCVIQGSS